MKKFFKEVYTYSDKVLSALERTVLRVNRFVL